MFPVFSLSSYVVCSLKRPGLTSMSDCSWMIVREGGARTFRTTQPSHSATDLVLCRLIRQRGYRDPLFYPCPGRGPRGRDCWLEEETVVFTPVRRAVSQCLEPCSGHDGRPLLVS